MRFTIHTRLTMSPLEFHHGRKARTKLTNIVKDNRSFLSDWTTLNVSEPPKPIPIYVARNEKTKVTEHITMAGKKIIPFCASQMSPKKRPVKRVSGYFHYPYTFSEKRNQKISLEGKYKEQPRIAIDGTEHTVRTADNKILHRNLISTPIEFQRSPKKDMSRNKHKLRGPAGKYVSASETTRLMEEGIISESRRYEVYGKWTRTKKIASSSALIDQKENQCMSTLTKK